MYILKFFLAAIFIIITFTSTALSQTESVRFKYRLTENANVSLEIRSGPGGSGTLIKTILNNQSQSAGNHSITWDGTNQSGNQVATGIYYYRMKAVTGSNTYTKEKQFQFIK